MNALVALATKTHEFHDRVTAWVQHTSKKGPAQLATCSITELGFVRVLLQAPQFDVTITQARDLLTRLKASKRVRFDFIADDHDVSCLPAWVRSGRQTTDGHLAELARAHGAVLATLDRGIPNAFYILV